MGPWIPRSPGGAPARAAGGDLLPGIPGPAKASGSLWGPAPKAVQGIYDLLDPILSVLDLYCHVSYCMQFRFRGYGLR